MFLTHAKGCCRYTIPGVNGSLELGKRILNFVWYWNRAEDSLTDILTDVKGHTHQYYVPPRKLREEIWGNQKAITGEMLPFPFLELISKIRQPYVTVISNTTASKASFFGGKILLVGDALTLFRPHNALSSNQATSHCLELKKAPKGDIISLRMGDPRAAVCTSQSLASRFLGGLLPGWLVRLYQARDGFWYRIGTSVAAESLV